MKNLHKRKLRQLNFAVKNLKKSKKDSNEKVKLIQKIQGLINELKFTLAKFHLKKAFATLGLIASFSFSNAIHAQHYDPVVQNAYGVVGSDILIDMDNDGDLDLFIQSSQSYYSYYGGYYYYYSTYNYGVHKLNYYKNEVTNGISNFVFQENVLERSANGNFKIEAQDIDNDGDLDIIVADKINEYYFGNNFEAYYYIKNLGNANEVDLDFNVINSLVTFESGDFYAIPQPNMLDLDNDLDLDLVLNNTSELIYFENIGDAQIPLFDVEQINPFGLTNFLYEARRIFNDIDHDGDFDFFAGGTSNNLKYYENIGSANNPIFDTEVMNPFGINLGNVYEGSQFVDFDNDNDLDLFVTHAGGIKFYENIGGILPEFATVINNPFCIESSTGNKIQIADLEGDSDLDIFTFSFNNIYYYQNNPTGTTYYLDNDNDNYGNPNLTTQSTTCSAPNGYTLNNSDCDDSNANVFYLENMYADQDLDLYGAGPIVSICRGWGWVDGYETNNYDCNDNNPSVIWEQNWYQDSDSDSYGNSEVVEFTCNNPGNYVNNGNDCDDENPSLHIIQYAYPDVDLDGFGSGTWSALCENQGATNDLDCNDLDATINPTVFDIPNNGVDENCDGISAESSASIDETNNLFVSIFPNPGSDEVTINLGNENKNFTIKMFNSIGGEVLNLAYENLSSVNLNTKNLQSGIYFVEISLDEKQQVFKWVKK